MRRIFRHYGVLIPLLGIILVLTELNPKNRDDWYVDLQRRPVVFYLSLYTNALPVLLICFWTDSALLTGSIIAMGLIITLFWALFKDITKGL